MEATTEWKMGGGSTHATALGLGNKVTHPKFLSFVWDWEGKQHCFSSPTRLQEILKSHHLQARVTLAALCVPTPTSTSTFFSAVIRFFFIVLTASGGGLVSLIPPPLGLALYITGKYSVPVSG